MNPATHQRICAEIQERHQREMSKVVAQRNELEKLCNYNERLMQELLQQRDELAAALEKLARLGNEPHQGNSIGNQIARDALAKVGAGRTATLGHNAELCGGPSGPSERAPGYASAAKTEE